MRIALVAPPWLPVPPPAYGGTEAVIDRLARGFVGQGHHVELFTTGDSDCPVPRSWVLPAAATEAMGDAAVEIHHVESAYARLRSFDIVHDHTLVGPILSASYPELQVVTTNHGPFDGCLRSLYRAISPRVPIIAISRHQARSARPVPIRAVIHHGVEAERFPLGRGDGGYFLYLGRMNLDKGVRAAAEIARRAGVPLLIAAKNREPAERSCFEREVRPLLGQGVEYVGEIGGSEKLTLLGGARALLNPIQWPEPFGLVMIEALACGTPVLALRNGSAPEIVEHGVTGFLSDDLHGLELALERVDEIDRTACRRAAERSFSSARMVRQHLDLYAQLLASAGRPAERTTPLRPVPTSALDPASMVDDLPA